jgi:aminoglycoside phosphotransferase (APT) family kinase protein
MGWSMHESEQAAFIADLTSRATEAGDQWRPGLEVTNVRSLTGGSSSLTFVADATAGSITEPVVLKVAPPGLEPVRNRDVLRQGRVMQAVQGVTGVAAPAIRFEHPGSPPEVPPFVGMQMLPGECVEPILDGDRPRDTATRSENRARYIDATRMLAHLHQITPADVGLGDEPHVSISDEINRWTRAFETVPEDLQGDYTICAKALHASIPPAVPAVINHGDYRLGNTLCEGDRVTAIIDWEIWSVGDPRIDLTWLAYFTDEARHPATKGTEPCGTPTIDEVVGLYEETLGSRVENIDWFHALTRYKEAAATALLIKRARRAGTMTESFKLMEPALPTLLSEAMDLIRL